MIDRDITGQYHASLRELLHLEVVDIVATAVEQGFTSRDTLEVLIETARQRLGDIEEAKLDNKTLPAGPHSVPALVDTNKTPGTDALPEIGRFEIDPGVG